MKLANWRPKNDNIAVAKKGVISSDDFSQEDLDNVVARATNRKIDISTFLIGAGLVPVKGQFQIDLNTDTVKKQLDAILPLSAKEIADILHVSVNASATKAASEATTVKRTRRTKAQIEADKK